MSSLAARWTSWRRAGSRMAGGAPLSPVTFPLTRLRGLVEIAPGADLSADPATWSWVDITQWVRHDLGISTVVGRRDQAGFADPSRASLKLDNRDGRFSRRNPTGPYYGQLTRSTPIRLSVDPGDGMHTRYYGFVNEWPKRWDRSGNDSTVTITCSGMLRRLQRSQSLGSPLRRTISGVSPGDYAPIAYWPGEDGTDARQVASAILGVGPIPASGLNYASDSSLVGSAPLPTLTTGARFVGAVPSYTATQQWVNHWVLSVPSEPAADTTLWETQTNSPNRIYRVVLAPGAPSRLYLRTYIGVTLESEAFIDLDGTAGPTATESGFYGQTFLYGLSSSPFGGSISVEVKMFDDQGDEFLPSTSLGQIVGSTTTGNISWAGIRSAGAGLDGATVGHNAVFVDAAFNIATDQTTNAAAMNGFAGEQAHVRLERVFREEGLAFYCTAAESATMGPQPIGTILDVARDCERADLGVLYEREFGTAYKALSEYYNAPVQLALDFDAGHVGDPPEADDSDLRFRNLWTVSRSSGSSATVIDQDFDDAVGVYDGSTSVNVQLDSQAADVAGWLVHRDTVDGDYWTGLKLRFSRTPDIIAGWCALPYGSRITIANPPSQADPGSIDAVIEGWAERWDQVSWEATLNTGPAQIYQVAVADESRIDSDSSTVTADVATGAGSFSITTADPLDLWTTDSTDFPLDVEIAGQVITLSAISGASSPQTATVSAWGVNGITKDLTAGDEVHVADPAIAAL